MHVEGQAVELQRHSCKAKGPPEKRHETEDGLCRTSQDFLSKRPGFCVEKARIFCRCRRCVQRARHVMHTHILPRCSSWSHMPASLLVTHAGFLVQRPRHVMHTHILPPVQLLVTHAGFPVQRPRQKRQYHQQGWHHKQDKSGSIVCAHANLKSHGGMGRERPSHEEKPRSPTASRHAPRPRLLARRTHRAIHEIAYKSHELSRIT